MKIIDLTLPLYSGMPVFPGDPEVSIELVATLEKDGWNMRRMQVNTHDATHMNVPIHMVAGGKNLDDYSLETFCGPAKIYMPDAPMEPSFGYIFRDRNIDTAIAEEIKKVKPRFVGISSEYEWDIEIEKDLLVTGIIQYEHLANTAELPENFFFYGMPLKIKEGDGSPVRAFAVVD
ncbi:MAG: cyclase family protein [Candidatus Pacebacteria bacterium]|nr:cyclase family protein [Candidatus Paceibacterota bacterium]